MNIKITILVENSVAFPFLPGTLPDMLGEHGIAILIDNGAERILYDTGRGRTLMLNLAKSGYESADTGKVIISHGHLDHTSGLQAFLETRQSTEVFCHPAIFEGKYSKRGTNMHYIGNPFTIEDLEASGAKIKFNREAQMVASHLMLSGSIPRVHGWEQSESNFFIKKEEAYLPDHFEDDQSLFIQHKDGIIVLTGCGHAGIINILEHAVNCCGTEKILAVIGGLHLEGASSERIGLTVKFLRDFGVEKLIIGHCTGFEAMYSFRQAFGDSLIPLSVGKQIEF